MSFNKQVKAWLAKQGAGPIDHEEDQFNPGEMSHLRGLLTHRFGVQPETVADLLQHPTLFPAELLAEINGESVPDPRQVPQYTGPSAAELQAKKEAEEAAAKEKADAEEADRKAAEDKRIADEAAAKEEADRVAAEQAAASEQASKAAEETGEQTQEPPAAEKAPE